MGLLLGCRPAVWKPAVPSTHMEPLLPHWPPRPPRKPPGRRLLQAPSESPWAHSLEYLTSQTQVGKVTSEKTPRSAPTAGSRRWSWAREGCTRVTTAPSWATALPAAGSRHPHRGRGGSLPACFLLLPAALPAHVCITDRQASAQPSRTRPSPPPDDPNTVSSVSGPGRSPHTALAEGFLCPLWAQLVGSSPVTPAGGFSWTRMGAESTCHPPPPRPAPQPKTQAGQLTTVVMAWRLEPHGTRL